MEGFAEYRELFEAHFSEFIDQMYPTESRLDLACRYALEGKGKRVRPILALLCAELCGAKAQQAMIPAIVLEMIHTYSLVHDDLPILDDDDYRRNRKTVHKQFDEATALLVGDALLTDCWAILSGRQNMGLNQQSFALDDGQYLQMIRTLSGDIGSRGMVAGQMLDVLWTGKECSDFELVSDIHFKKTGGLIASACAMGAIAGKGDETQVRRLHEFGLKLGLAFQIVDDLMDDCEGTGKSSGKDKEQGKITFLTTMSQDRAQEYAQTLTNEALSLLDSFGTKSEALRKLASLLLVRRY